MSDSPHSPRRQRRALYSADNFERRRRMAVPLSRELRARFHVRAVPLRKGDTVRVLSGSFAGREERVAKIDRRELSITLDNVTLKTADEKLKPLALRASHLVLTRLNLADPWRRRRLRVRDEDVTPEERGEAPEEAAAEPAVVEAPKEPPAAEPVASEAPEAAPEEKPKGRRKAKPAPTEAPEEDA
jgi:ribosomal protein uL24